MVRGVKRVIRSRRSKPKKKNERNCHYLIVGSDGEDYAATTHEEAVQLAAQVGGTAYLNCAGRKTLLEE